MAGTGEWMSQSLLALGFCIVACVAQADKRARVEAAEEAVALRKGWNGRVQDAECTEEEDKRRILEELETSGCTADVNYAIRVLLESGMSTPAIRLAHARTGQVKEAGRVPWSCMVLCVAVNMHFPLDHLMIALFLHLDRCPDSPRSGVDRYNYGDDWCAPPYAVASVWISTVELLQSFAWILMFVFLPMDKRGFAVQVMTKFSIWSLILYVIGMKNTEHINRLWCFALGPLALIAGCAGPGRVAGVPLLGPLFVIFVFSGTGFGLIKKASTTAVMRVIRPLAAGLKGANRLTRGPWSLARLAA